MALPKRIFNVFSLFIIQLTVTYSVQPINSESTVSVPVNDSVIEESIKWENLNSCPNINYFNEAAGNLTDTQISRITCICGSVSYASMETGISMHCIYGTTLNDIKRVLTQAKSANIPVYKIGINGLILEENSTESLMSALTSVYNNEELKLHSLEIKTCQGATPLQISGADSNSSILLLQMERLIIEECELYEMPKELLRNSPKLTHISLPNNKIKIILKDDFGGSANTIEHINLEGNLITDVEFGALSQLTVLKELKIGEHNFAKKKILEEVAQLPVIEYLDMTRIDGINDEQQFSSNTLKTLILTGCNLKAIHSINFGQLSSLKELDLRVNLIERIHDDSFLNLTQLQRLNMAGNFIKKLNSTNIWNGLKELKQLDLGWNDFKQLNMSIFNSLNGSLENLDLRHNEKLIEIEANAIYLPNLKFLNVSHSALRNIKNETFATTKLQTLDLSFNNLSYIDAGSFDNIKETIEHLNISGNQLRSINVNLLEGMVRLKEIDLSENPWDCDESMEKIFKFINNRYKDAANNSMEFELKNSKTTLCDRPYSKRGMPIFDLSHEDFLYDKESDTTPAPEITTTTMSASDENITEASIIDWQKITIVVGENEIENTLDGINEDAGKPAYDINSVRYGQRHYKKLSNTWVSAIIVVILIILTVICVILVVRRKHTELIKDPTLSKACVATTTEL